MRKICDVMMRIAVGKIFLLVRNKTSEYVHVSQKFNSKISYISFHLFVCVHTKSNQSLCDRISVSTAPRRPAMEMEDGSRWCPRLPGLPSPPDRHRRPLCLNRAPLLSSSPPPRNPAPSLRSARAATRRRHLSSAAAAMVRSGQVSR